ncbi:MAG TPA: NapC/NirT family cytochrome c [Dehalococcoidia bacterium]|nr:NapC/NirT family cytochrome c [Dehalococcoidia bacterium]
MQEQRPLPAKPRSVLGKAVAFWTSRPLLLAVVMGLVAAGFAFGGMKALSWMETPDFCSRCHTMQPEVTAHINSPHETVACAECHVGSGFKGLAKSKIAGFRQMLKIAFGDYARPIPPAAHGMPPASETCLRCHDPSRQREDVLITRSHFQEDAANTEQRVALVVRLSGDKEPKTAGIHWHVLSKVEYVAEDKEGRVIDWIGVERPDGTREEFISQNLVEISEQAGRKATDLKQTSQVRRMSCYDCHNRVGHQFATPARAIDEAIAQERIDRDIPLIKKNALAVMSPRYASLAEADQAFRDLEESYHRDYPYLFLEKPGSLALSLTTIREIYHQTAAPQMRAFPQDYPSYLGHTDSAGCFRCHDGGHYKIENGRLSDEPIPARCSLCHTFPSVGPRAPNVMLGPPPSTHTNRLWVFEHKAVASSPDPSQSNCATCHSRTYCTNCHSTGATQVKHDNMLFDHASVIRESSEQACAYCHQKPFCQRCHEKDQDATSPQAREAPP